jgi:hypothetical protein
MLTGVSQACDHIEQSALRQFAQPLPIRQNPHLPRTYQRCPTMFVAPVEDMSEKPLQFSAEGWHRMRAVVGVVPICFES